MSITMADPGAAEDFTAPLSLQPSFSNLVGMR
jgi:hypothetical protein